LFYELQTSHETLCFQTQRGELIVRKGPEQSIVMDFPRGLPTKVEASAELMAQLSKAVGLPKINQIVELWMCNSTRKLAAVVDSPDCIEKLSPNMTAIVDLEFPDEWNVKGIIVTSPDTKEYDFISRYFAPLNGIPEDPVTGSAHTVLGVIYGQKLGKDKMKGFQQSPRGGEMVVELVKGTERMLLSGKARTMLEGTLKNLE
jgi:PhzF family phenazine biosynthesis protein